MVPFARLYTFLGQIFGYDNTDIEKRSATMSASPDALPARSLARITARLPLSNDPRQH
jgi:hypothetical protein